MTYRNIRYAAPELRPLSDDMHDVRPTAESDIFSLGILLLQVGNHKPPRSVEQTMIYIFRSCFMGLIEIPSEDGRITTFPTAPIVVIMPC